MTGTSSSGSSWDTRDIDRPRAYLTVDGGSIQFWKSVEITRSIEACATSFKFSTILRQTCFDFAKGLRYHPAVQPGSAIEAGFVVGADNTQLISGYVDSFEISGTADEQEVTVSGRSKTADLIDCTSLSSTTAKSQWKNLDVVSLAELICTLYPVNITADVDTGAPIPRFSVEPGETCYTSLERLAAMRSLLLTDNPDGDLVFTRAGTTVLPITLTPAQCTSIRVTCDTSRLFSEYWVCGQRHSTKADTGNILNQVAAVSRDDLVARTRVLMVDAECEVDAASAQARAEWEAATRHRKAVQVHVTVPYWGYTTSAGVSPWEPNSLLDVDAPAFGIDDKQLLITACTYKYTEQDGHTTEMILAPVGAYALLPPLEQPERSKTTKKVGAYLPTLPGGVQ